MPVLNSVEQWNLLLMTGMTCLWFFAVGTAFGSFLNVVVYRMPRGLPVGGSSSHCPGCERAIPWYDNVPIFGWMRLRGRCQCRANLISARYPIVETLVGLVVFALMMVELLSGGANLPTRRLDHRSGVVWVVWSLQWDLIGTYLYHITLMYVLLGLALIELDGFPPPKGWVLFGLAVGLITPAAAPFLQGVPIAGFPPEREVLALWDAPARAGVGLAAGLGLGLVAGSAWRRHPRHPFAPAHLIAALALAGTYLGWQAAFATAMIAAVGLLVLRRATLDEAALNAIPPSLIVWVATFVQILLWRFTTRNLAVWPGPWTTAPAWAACGAFLLITTFIISRIPPPKPPPLPKPDLVVLAEPPSLQQLGESTPASAVD